MVGKREEGREGKEEGRERERWGEREKGRSLLKDPTFRFLIH